MKRPSRSPFTVLNYLLAKLLSIQYTGVLLPFELSFLITYFFVIHIPRFSYKLWLDSSVVAAETRMVAVEDSSEGTRVTTLPIAMLLHTR